MNFYVFHGVVTINIFALLQIAVFPIQRQIYLGSIIIAACVYFPVHLGISPPRVYPLHTGTDFRRQIVDVRFGRQKSIPKLKE